MTPTDVKTNPADMKALAPLPGLDLSSAMLAAAQLGKEGVEVLERLHVIAKEERAFAARGQYAQAMCDLKADLPPVVKSVVGQHGITQKGTRTAGMYAPIDTIAAVLDPVATKHGFSYRFGREVSDGKEWVVCIVTHRGGHSETTRYPSMDDAEGKGKSALHARGSGDTYARRYALTAAFAIVTADPDTDGNDGERMSGDKISDTQVANLTAMLDEAPEPADEKRRLLKWLKVESLYDIPAERAADIIGLVDKKRMKGWPS